MNQDLHDLTGFGTEVSKSNCFTYHNNNDDELDETMKNTGCSDVLSMDEQMVQIRRQ